MRFIRPGLLAAGLLGVLLGASTDAAAQDRTEQNDRAQQAERQHEKEAQAQKERQAQQERQAQGREHAQDGEHAQRPMSAEERRHMTDRYRAEAVHRERVAKLKRLYELAKASGDEARIKKIEELWHRQASVYQKRTQRADQGLANRRDLKDAADKHLQRGRGDMNLQRGQQGKHGRQQQKPNDRNQDRNQGGGR